MISCLFVFIIVYVLCKRVRYLSYHKDVFRVFVYINVGVVIINTSRGTNVDEAALLAALESGKVRAAGLDVYADEPATNKALYSHPMVSCTPHIGAATNEAQKRIGAEIVDIIKAM